MSEYRDDEALIRSAMEELPMSNEMPPALKSKLANRALESKRKTQTARRPWMVGVMTAGLAVLAVGAFFLLPKPALGKSWELIRQAVNQVQTFQLEVSTNGAQGKVEHVHIATAGGKMKIDTGESEMVYIDGNSVQVYDEKENKITKIKLPISGLADIIPGALGEISKSFDLKKEFAKFEAEYGKDHIQIQPIRDENGRRVYDVTLNDPKGNGVVNMTVDADTDLPNYIHVQEKNGEETTVSMRYNEAVDIQPNFPAGAKIEEVDMSKMGDIGKDMERTMGDAFKSFGKGMK
jgi:hypothetical protein